jgi:hypothetical protein
VTSKRFFSYSLAMSLNAGISELPPEDLMSVAKGMYQKSLYLTAKYLLNYSQVNWNTHRKPIITLQSPSKRKLIVMPRGTFKTSLASVATPIWMLINNPNLRILLDSELYSNSKNSLREIKAHLESELMTTLFGQFRNDSCWNEGEAIINQRTQVLKEASLTCSGIGAQKTGQHYDVIIADDMNSPANSGTSEACQKVVDHYRYYTSLLEPWGTLVLVGTRYSANDLIGHVLANEMTESSKLT